jgi:arginine N-succinyltransferase
MRMLEDEGFRAEGYVDIFDGGPTMVAWTDNVTSVKNACHAKVTAVEASEGERAILATGHLGTFRACFGARVLDGEGGIAIDSASADLLDVSAGDIVWSVAR